MAKDNKDSFYAKVAFFLSLGFWVPLFNIAVSILAIYYARRAMKLINKDPKKFGGFTYALIALILGITSLLMSVLGLGIYFYQQQCACP